jgi:hypothetical protein
VLRYIAVVADYLQSDNTPLSGVHVPFLYLETVVASSLAPAPDRSTITSFLKRRYASVYSVASIDPELLENLSDMEKVDADSVDDCTDESVMEFLESTQERDASVTDEFVKSKVLAKVTFAMSEKDPALRVMKAVADYISCTEI